MALVRLALVGFGKWGRNYIKAAEDSGEAVVSHVVVRGYEIEPAVCDAVVYAGHPARAAERCEEALVAGLPILCEKPAGLSLADAERIAAAEAASKAFVLVGHQHLFAEPYEKLIEQDRKSAYLVMSTGGVSRDDYSPEWDYGPHAVAMAMGILGGPPDEIHVLPLDLARTIKERFPAATPRGMHRGDRVASVLFGREEGIRRAEVREISGDGLMSDITVAYCGHCPQEPPLTRQVRAFAKAVKAGGTDDYRFGAKWAVDVARVLEACASP